MGWYTNSQNTVTTQEASFGINYYISPQYTLNGNYSWNKLNEKGTNDPIIPGCTIHLNTNLI